MRVITIKNPIPLDSPFTIVSQDYDSGSLLYVEDSSGYKANDLILVGGLGNEKSESTDLSSTVPGTGSLTITGMDHSHSTDESVQTLLWNRFDIQYKITSTGTWTALVTASSLGEESKFDWSTGETNYRHGAGDDTYYYRSRYYNSATADYSDWSDAITGEGLSRVHVGSMVEEVRRNCKDESNQKVSDITIIGYLNYAQDVVKSLYKKWPWLQAEAVVNPTTLALPSDFKRAYRLKYNFVDGTESQTYYLKYLPLVDFQNRYTDNNASTSDYLEYYTIDDINSVIKLGPSPETTTAILTLVYEKDITDLEAYTDSTVIPLPELLIAYATAKVWKLKSNPEEYTSWMENFSDLLQVLDQARPVTYHPRTIKRYQGRSFGGRMNIVSEDYIE
jgi:hypothetical protein